MDIQQGQKVKLKQGSKIFPDKSNNAYLRVDEIKSGFLFLTYVEPSFWGYVFGHKETKLTAIGEHSDLKIGRAAGNDFKIDIMRVSGKHGVFSYDKDAGTFVYTQEPTTKNPSRGENVELVKSPENKAKPSKPVQTVIAGDEPVEISVVTTRAALRKGTKLNLLKDILAVEVIDVKEDPPELKFTFSGTTHTIKAGKQFTIGRDQKKDLILDNPASSRDQGFIEFNPQTKSFDYVHGNDRNSAWVSNPDKALAQDVREDERVETIVGNIGDDDKAGARQAFELKHGMSLLLHPHIPTYEIIEEEDRLILKRQGDNKRGPELMTIMKSGQVILGKGTDADYKLRHLGISDVQSIIAWSPEDNAFFMSNIGQSVASVSFSKEFFEDQEKINLAIKKAGTSPFLAAQLDAINLLIAEVERDFPKLVDVQANEEATIINPIGGAKTEDSQRGYELWLQTFRLLYQPTLSTQQQQNIIDMADEISNIGKDREKLRVIESKLEIEGTPKYESGKRFSYSDVMDKYVDDLNARFESEGRLLMVSGFRRHHTVSEIVKNKEGGYDLITYNAGAEAKYAPSGPDNPKGDKVMGYYVQTIKKGSIKDLIRLIAEKKIRRWSDRDFDGYDVVSKEIESHLEPIKDYSVTEPQHKGNCTTRSTREAIKKRFENDPLLFENIHRHVSDPNVSDAKDILSALRNRKAILNKLLGQDMGNVKPNDPVNRGEDGPQSFAGNNDSWVGSSERGEGQIR